MAIFKSHTRTYKAGAFRGGKHIPKRLSLQIFLTIPPLELEHSLLNFKRLKLEHEFMSFSFWILYPNLAQQQPSVNTVTVCNIHLFFILFSILISAIRYNNFPLKMIIFYTNKPHISLNNPTQSYIRNHKSKQNTFFCLITRRSHKGWSEDAVWFSSVYNIIQEVDSF